MSINSDVLYPIVAPQITAAIMVDQTYDHTLVGQFKAEKADKDKLNGAKLLLFTLAAMFLVFVLLL